ncbi:MAG: tetratricopeptide repeat protein, partial [Myxococcota bacterium]
AAESVRGGRLDTAYWLLRASLAQDPKSAAAWNSMAVVLRRANRMDQAEDIYRYGIEALPEKATFLRNYR